MIRWAGLVAFVVIVGMVTIFTFFFLDTILKGVIEEQASLAVGAKVEIGDLKFRIRDLSLDIVNLQVADPEEPMRNAVEIGSLSLDLGASALLRKKIWIERMKVLDLAWNTPRKTSGALPLRLQRKLRKRDTAKDLALKAERRVEECVLPNLSILTDLKKRPPEELLKGVSLQSAAFLGDYSKRISSARETWEKRLKELPTKEEIQKEIKSLESLKGQRPTEVAQLSAYLEKLRSLQKKVEETQKALTAAQREFEAETNRLKTSLQEVERLKETDLQAVLAKLGVPHPRAEDLICVLLGKEVAHKVMWALSMYRTLGAYTSKDRPQRPKPIPRMKGMDVRFPITQGYPDVLIEWAEFSVRPGIKRASGGFAFEKLTGELRGLTTHPVLYGKPTLFRLNGSMVGQLAKDFSLSGQLDRRGAIAEDRVALSISELKIDRKEVSEDSPLRLASALLNVNGLLQVKGELLEGRLLLNVSNPKVVWAPSAALFGELLKNIGTFDLSLSIGGTLDQPSLGLSSSAVRSLSAGLENLIRKEMKEVQEGIRQWISSRIEKDLKANQEEVAGFERWISGELSERLGLFRPPLGPAPRGSKEFLRGLR